MNNTFNKGVIMKIDIREINKKLDKEIEFAKRCTSMPHFLMGLQQAKNVINNINNEQPKITNEKDLIILENNT